MKHIGIVKSLVRLDTVSVWLSNRCGVAFLPTDAKSLDSSRPGSRLPHSPAPPTSQHDVKVKLESKTQSAPKKAQVCVCLCVCVNAYLHQCACVLAHLSGVCLYVPFV